MCEKRRVTSKRAAREIHSQAGWRVRVYLCGLCGHLHVSNDDKRGESEGAKRQKAKYGRGTSRTRARPVERDAWQREWA